MLIRVASICMILVSLTCANCRGQAGKEGTDAAVVQITSAPSGADIYVDEKFAGNAPSQIKLKSGEHSIKITAGGEEWSRLLQVTSGEVTVHADLSPQSDDGSRNSTPEKQRGPATEDLRALAQAIKQCPQEVMTSHKWGKRPTEIEQIRRGPPQNVAWDVRPSDSVRAPYTGYIQFTIRTELWVPPESYEKYSRTYPGSLEAWLSHSHPSEYRYEFNLGPSRLELVKMLSRDEGDTVWKTTNLLGSCWGQAVQKTQTPSPNTQRK